jgi:hypothetical protein
MIIFLLFIILLLLCPGMQEQVPFLFFYYVGTRSRCGTCMNVLLLNNCSLPTAGTAVYTELPGY